jgi:hypothetical protein
MISGAAEPAGVSARARATAWRAAPTGSGHAATSMMSAPARVYTVVNKRISSGSTLSMPTLNLKTARERRRYAKLSMADFGPLPAGADGRRAVGVPSAVPRGVRPAAVGLDGPASDRIARRTARPRRRQRLG